MKIIQIAESIHGELPHIGYPCTILRLAGCNLSCVYCDVPPAMEENVVEMSRDEIVGVLKSMNNACVLITGGEPLLQWKDLYELLKIIRNDYHITIETNGALPLTRELRTCVDEIVMDIKLDKPLENFSITDRNIPFLGEKDVIKFVYDGWQQFEIAWSIAKKSLQGHFPGTIVFSPIDKQQAFVDKFVVNCKTFKGDVRMQIQIHKYLGCE